MPGYIYTNNLHNKFSHTATLIRELLRSIAGMELLKGHVLYRGDYNILTFVRPHVQMVGRSRQMN